MLDAGWINALLQLGPGRRDRELRSVGDDEADATSHAWGPPINLGRSVNTRHRVVLGSISADGSTLYFVSDRPTAWGPCSVYQTTITPVVDFNGDGKVDDAEVRALLDNWGKDEPLCDIGPTPFGDGVVDMQDMAVLTRYASQKLADPTLVACWELDEKEGTDVSQQCRDLPGPPGRQSGLAARGRRRRRRARAGRRR